MSYLTASWAVRSSSGRKAVTVVDRRKGQSQWSFGMTSGSVGRLFG